MLQGEAASPFAFEAFLNGPRICIGKTFALMEVKTQLVEIVSKFRFVKSTELEALGDRPLPLKNPTITLQARVKLMIGIERL